MGLLYDKVRAGSKAGGAVGGSLYSRAQSISQDTQHPNVSAPKGADVMSSLPDSMKSPLALTGKTTISQAPPKKVPFGFIGRAAKAAFDVTNNAIDNTAQKFGDMLDTFGPAEQSPYGTDYTKDTSLTIGMTPKERQAYYEGQTKIHSNLNKGIKLGEFGLSLANLYPPIAQFNAELSAAKELPGPFSLPAKAIDHGFQKVSELGSGALGAGVDELKKQGVISPETADAIKPFTQELAGFATLVVGSHLGFKAMEKGLGEMKVDPNTGEKSFGGIMGKLPVSDIAKERINRGVQLGTSLSMQPFSTAFGLAHSMIVTKIEQRKADGIDVTPEEGQKIVEEVAHDLPQAHIEYAKENDVPTFIPDSELVDSRGKQDLRTVMTNLNEAGYDKDQIAEIMQKVIENNNTGRFTPKEISDVARKLDPSNPTLPPSEIIKGGKARPYNPRRAIEAQPAPEAVPVEPTQTQSAPVDVTAPIDTQVAPETRTTKVSSDQLPVKVKTKEGELRVSRLEARMRGKLENINPDRAEAEGLSTYRQMNKPEQRRKAAEYVDANPEEAMQVLKGEKPAPEGILHNAIAMALEARAETEADGNLAVKLGSLRATRQGQEISILSEADPTDAFSAIHEIIKARTAKSERVTKTEASKSVKTDVSEGKKVLSESKLKIQEAESLLEKILC